MSSNPPPHDQLPITQVRAPGSHPPGRGEFFPSGLLGSLSVAATLGVLVGVALLGHFYEWKLPAFSKVWPWTKSDKDDDKDDEGKAAPLTNDDEVVEKPRKEELKDIELAPGTASRAGFHLATAQQRSMNHQIKAFGVLDFDQTRYAHLSTRAQGAVWRVEKGLGDRVHKGDVLAVIEAAEVGKAKAEFLQSVVQVNVRTTNLTFLNMAKGSTPEKSIRDAETGLREARIKLLNDQQALVNLGLPIHSDELAGLTDEKMVRQVRLLGLPASLTQGLDPDALTANLLPLKAPFDGEVVSRDVVIGEIAMTTIPQFVLADLRSLWVMLDVRREEAAHLALGQEVTFLPDGVKDDPNAEPLLAASTLGLLAGSQGELLGALSALPERSDVARGRLNWISAEVDEKTRTVKARAEAVNPQRRLRPHTFGNGRILVRSQPEAVVVPSEAIQTDGPNQLVFVHVTDEKFAPRLVTTGLRDEKYTEILSGVSPGERVVTVGSHVLKTELFKDRLGKDD
jgi:membrane fusion protein, heavy metal efflux system